MITAKCRSEEREMDFDLKWMQEMPERKCREKEVKANLNARGTKKEPLVPAGPFPK